MTTVLIRDKCPKCEGIRLVAAELTRGEAIIRCEALAAEFMEAAHGDRTRAVELAKMSILMKNPTLVVTCERCKHEWLE